MRRFLLLVFCLASCFVASAQTCLKGIVVDEDNIPQCGADLLIIFEDGESMICQADDNGCFNIPVHAMPIKIEAKYYGYKTATYEIKDGVTDNIIIEMTPGSDDSGILGFSPSGKYAVKTNILYDFTGTINLGLEYSVAPQWTVDVSFNINQWNVYNGCQLKHFLIQPEGRYWLSQSYKGHFVGAHVHYALFDMGNVQNGIKFLGTNFSSLTKHRFDGWLLGLGVGYGYVFNIYDNLNLELEIGLGYAYLEYDKYHFSTNTPIYKAGNHNYWGITKLNVGLSYLF